MRDAFEGHPLVGEVRGVGFIGGIELVEDRRTRKRFPNVGKVGTLCRDHCFRNDLIMRAVRDTMIFAPPPTLVAAEIDYLVAWASAAIAATARDLGRQ